MRTNFVVAIATVALIGLYSQGFATDISSSARFVGAKAVPKTSSKIGGLSGITLIDDGQRFLALSDHGRFISGQLEREGLAITAITIEHDTQLKNKKGII